MDKIKEPLVLAFDIGTQSTRAILFDKKGNLIGKNKIEFTPYYSLKPGWAEQNPDLYFEKMCEASNALKARFPEEWERIVAVSVTTIRDTSVCIDKQGKPVRDVILWLDQRMADIKFQISKGKKFLFSLVGMKEAAEIQAGQGKCNWIRLNEPDNWAKTDKYIMLSGYINLRLTGKLVDSVASQIGHIPFDYKNKRWMSPKDIKADLFPVEEEKRYELVQPGESMGEISPEASELTGIPAGIPVIASGSDKGCETLGTGCIGDGIAALSFGTTATIQMTSKKYVEPQTFMPAYPAVLPDAYNDEMQIYRGFWMITWFKEQFANKEVEQAKKMKCSPEQLLDERLKEIPPGSEGLILQPYWSPTLKSPEARGAVIGFSDNHTRAHLYRAIIEGIGYGLYGGMKEMERRLKYKIKMVTVSGGGSSSDAVCQITADMFGLPVKRVQTYETSGLGAAMAAFVGIKAYNSFEEAIENMVHYSVTFEPDMANHKIYADIFKNVYSKIYKQLKPMYKNIKDILTN
jgi:sugar (pentulose or hexulose) kinase